LYIKLIEHLTASGPRGKASISSYKGRLKMNGDK